LKFGNTTKNFSLEFISNQSFTKSEVDKWLKEMNQWNLPIPTVNEVFEKSNWIDEQIKNFVYTPTAVQQMLEIKDKLNLRHRNLALERTNWINKRDAFKEIDNDDQYQYACDQIDEIDRLIIARKSYIPSKSSKYQIIQINQKHRAANLDVSLKKK